MKRILSVILTLMLVLTLCGGALAETLSTFPIVEEPIKLTAYAVQSPQGGIANEMITLQKYAEMTNIQIDWVDVPQDTAADTLSRQHSSAKDSWFSAEAAS